MSRELSPGRVLAGFVVTCLVCVVAGAVLVPGVVGAIWTDATSPLGTADSPEHAVGTEPAAGTAAPTARRPSDEGGTTSGDRTTTRTPEAGSSNTSTSGASSTPASGSNGTSEATSHTYTVGEGANETSVTVVDSGNPGPTVVVVGGQHGNEPAGSRAASRVANWDVERGTLVVVPEANPVAVENGTREVRGRDLNGQFPVGERPRSERARIVWGVLERHDADVVVDLHSSRGIYGVDGGVGQAVFPTVTGPAVEHADVAVDRTNREFELRGNHSFERGNVMGRSGVSLTRKVAGDLEEPAYLVETTKQDTDLETRVEWTTRITWELLRQHGLVEGEQPPD